MTDEDRIVEIGARALFDDWQTARGQLYGYKAMQWESEPHHQKRFRKQFRASLAALSEAGLVVEQGWQPIESAPRDETHFLAVAVWPEQTTLTEICWNPWVAQWCRNAGPDDPQPVVIQPTHWRPKLRLPAPPAKDAPQ